MKKLKLFYDSHNTIINIVLAILAVMSMLFAIYTYYFPRSSSPELVVVPEVNSNYLIKNDKAIQGLNVTFNGRDIQKDNINLLVQKILLVNVGDAPIRLNDYSDEPLGLKIVNCKIIAVEPIIEQNNPLSYSLKLQIQDTSTIIINKLVYNPNEKVAFNVYMLKKSDKKELLYGTGGKIAGQDNIRLVGDTEFNKKSPWSSILTTIVFVVSILIILLVVGIIVEFLNDKLKSYFRKRKILKIYDYNLSRGLNKSQIALVKIFVIYGEESFLNLLTSLYKFNLQIDRSNFKDVILVENSIDHDLFLSDEYPNFKKRLLNENLIRYENESKVVFDVDFEVEIVNTLKKFKVLKIKDK